MVKVNELEFTEPGFDAVTRALPAVAISDAVIAALICEVESTVVVLAEPFQFTTAPAIKPVPATVSVKLGPPAVVELGLRELMTGGSGGGLPAASSLPMSNPAPAGRALPSISNGTATEVPVSI